MRDGHEISTDLIRSLVAEETQRAVALRRELHTYPETCFEEVRTSARIRAELDDAGIAHTDGLAGGTGTLGYLAGSAGSAIALRADIDGLPIVEEGDCEWKSRTQGRMHACGHDGHTAILLGAARVLKRLSERHALPNPVRLLFQPAEEGGAGGKRMVDDGALDPRPEGPAPRRIYGLHNFPGLALGSVATRRGALFASSDRFEISVTGRAAHAAWPHFGHDPIVAGSAIVTALQTIVARELDPLDAGVVSTTTFHSGTATNQIPSSATLQGTARALSEATRTHIERRIGEVAREVARAHRCEAAARYLRGYPVTRNDDGSVAEFERIARAHFDGVALTHMDVPVMGGEDFAFYAERIPACFYILGVEDGRWRSAQLHQPTFDFNDAAIPHGITAMVALALHDAAA
ncbi:MAG: M20 metallopeptidase family protein [Phycisphaerales bacterium]